MALARTLSALIKTLTLGTLLYVAAAPAYAQAHRNAGGAAGPLEVGTIAMARGPVERQISLPGRVLAYEQAAIRPRVSGLVTAILYTPGQPVKVGTPLFRLDDAAYVATLASDEAALSTAEANLPVKQAAYERAKKLVNQGSTLAQLETAQYEYEAAKAQLDAARAARDYARRQLDWTTVVSPIDGIPEVQSVSVGDLVQANQTDAMTTVTRLDPIYVDLSAPAVQMTGLQSQIESGQLTPNTKMAAELTLEDGTPLKTSGQLINRSAIVSTTTGTLSLRFVFENPGQRLLPGTFLRARVTIGTVDAWRVPQRATTRTATGDLTAFIVGPDNTSKRVILTEDGTSNNDWVVTAGLKDGDQLLVDGLRNMTPGKALKPIPAKVTAAGLVENVKQPGTN